MTIETLQSIVQGNINDDSANVDNAIDLAIKFLSNFFYVRTVDDSKTVSTGDMSIVKPSRCLKVLHVKIGDDYIRESDNERLQGIEDNDSQRWYVADNDDKIYLTQTISSCDDGASVQLSYLAGFTPLGGVAESETDLPERLDSILTSFVTYHYYGLLVSYVKNHKSEFPDMTVWDVIAIWDTWRIHSFDLLEKVQKQHFDLTN